MGLSTAPQTLPQPSNVLQAEGETQRQRCQMFTGFVRWGDENGKLKRMWADSVRDNPILKDLRKSHDAMSKIKWTDSTRPDLTHPWGS